MEKDNNECYIKAILLENCIFSQKTYKLLKKYDIPCKIIIIKQKDKHLYISNLIKTYPQLYLNRINIKGNVLLGSYNDFKEIINNLKISINNKNIIKLKEKYNWSNVLIIYLMNLFNSKI